MNHLLQQAFAFRRVALDLTAAVRPAPALVLARRAAVRFRVHPGQRIRCLAGSVWITQHGDPRDVVLDPGDEFTIDRSGELVVSGLRRSQLVLEA